jgi:uncharacterized protein YdiU (UPF0061 family)
MWAEKLGLATYHAELFSELETLMVQTPVDYTLFFRELSTVPNDIGPLKKSFYKESKLAIDSKYSTYETDPEGMDKRWTVWLSKWKSLIGASTTDANTAPHRSREEISEQMKLINPKYSLREWFVVPAYSQASEGNYSQVRELQEIMTQPYAEQSKDVEEKYYRLKPSQFFDAGGWSHYSCSS